jgi:hypothetical protein
MPILTELYVAARTRNSSEANTDDLPVLVVRRGANIVYTEPLYGGSFRVARGASGLWRFDMSEVNLDSDGLVIELHASGDNAWAPEHVIAWGISGRVGNERVIPLGAILDMAQPTFQAGEGTWISTDTGEGDRSLRLPTVGRGLDTTRARRAVVIAATDPYGGLFRAAVGPRTNPDDAGSNSSLTLQGGGAGRLFLNYTLPSWGSSKYLPRGEAVFHVVDLAAPFNRDDCAGGAFTLTIGSVDQWVPDYFAVFGVNSTIGNIPTALIPFVAASAFELKIMSSDSSKGFHSMVLPTARVLLQQSPDVVDPDDLGGVVMARGRPNPQEAGSGAGAASSAKSKRKRGR